MKMKTEQHSERQERTQKLADLMIEEADQPESEELDYLMYARAAKVIDAMDET